MKNLSKHHEVYSCAFRTHIHSAFIDIKFPYSCYLQWKILQPHRIIAASQILQPNQDQIVHFDENKSFQLELIYDEQSKSFLKRKTVMSVYIISKKKPTESKLLGRKEIDLAIIGNNDKLRKLKSYQLDYCSVKALIKFQIQLLSKQQLNALESTVNHDQTVSLEPKKKLSLNDENGFFQKSQTKYQKTHVKSKSSNVNDKLKNGIQTNVIRSLRINEEIEEEKYKEKCFSLQKQLYESQCKNQGFEGKFENIYKQMILLQKQKNIQNSELKLKIQSIKFQKERVQEEFYRFKKRLRCVEHDEKLFVQLEGQQQIIKIKQLEGQLLVVKESYENEKSEKQILIAKINQMETVNEQNQNRLIEMKNQFDKLEAQNEQLCLKVKSSGDLIELQKRLLFESEKCARDRSSKYKLEIKNLNEKNNMLNEEMKKKPESMEEKEKIQELMKLVEEKDIEIRSLQEEMIKSFDEKIRIKEEAEKQKKKNLKSLSIKEKEITDLKEKLASIENERGIAEQSRQLKNESLSNLKIEESTQDLENRQKGKLLNQNIEEKVLEENEQIVEEFEATRKNQQHFFHQFKQKSSIQKENIAQSMLLKSQLTQMFKKEENVAVDSKQIIRFFESQKELFMETIKHFQEEFSVKIENCLLKVQKLRETVGRKKYKNETLKRQKEKAKLLSLMMELIRQRSQKGIEKDLLGVIKKKVEEEEVDFGERKCEKRKNVLTDLAGLKKKIMKIQMEESRKIEMNRIIIGVEKYLRQIYQQKFISL